MGKAREDLRSNWRSADLAVAEKEERPFKSSSGCGFLTQTRCYCILQLLNSCNSCTSFFLASRVNPSTGREKRIGSRATNAYSAVKRGDLCYESAWRRRIG